MKLSIVIPIYNEETILEKEVEDIAMLMKQSMPETEYELLLVENGSHDRTHIIAEDLAKRHKQIRAMHLPNAGYGPAMKRGLLEATGEFVALFNIDFWDVEFIRKSFALQKEKNLDMVVGSKTMQGAEDTRPFFRRLITRTFNALLRFVFGFTGTDTHGMKLLVREKMIPIIQECKTEREIFDTEFVMRAQAAGLKTEEIPVLCQEKRKTTYNIAKRIPRTAKDLLVLFFSLRLKSINKFYAILFLFSVIVFFITAFWGFPDSPSPWFDNGVNLGIAKTFVEDGVYSLRLAPGVYVENRPLMISTNYPALLPIIISFWLFGIGLVQAQVVMILFLISFLSASYLLLKKWYSPILAISGIALAVTFLPFYGHGMSGGLGEVPGILYFFFALFLLKKEKPAQVFFCGILLGLASATKVFYILLLFSVGASELVLAIKNRKVPLKRWAFLALGIAIPMIVWLKTLMPYGFTAQGITQTFRYYGNPYDVGGTIGPNIIRFFTETTPIHFALISSVFFVMIILNSFNRKVRQGEFIITLFLFLNVWFFLKTPGWYRYLFPAHIIALLFFPSALGKIANEFKSFKIRLYAPTAIVVLLLAVQTIHLISNRDSRVYYNPAPRELAEILDKDIPNADVYIVDHPELWFLMNNKNARQFIHMNPYVSFGKNVFETGNLPRYIIGKDSDVDISKYKRVSQYDSYAIFERK